ncbi:hypothetical protein M2132_000328 [Dysgonomonas sp. PH5-45]|uniref:translocation/assembly module TamB domain-containing protein n=1 Tax=unclassified Dysgonomonas TaxID=2630389 RepID=UPI002476342A|nr:MULTISPECIES: translocation/assembly module TamB [unclassified Dysgonomonas]MDH6354008.1 hypothetical protein [Dysgonomonas sp. PH5-45]MDH6386910.1 hypothetical protein [Dysgonomonas sp. PH5-37]
MVYGLLNIPFVQEYAKDKIVEELKKKLGTDLGIAELHFQPFNTIELTGLYLYDKGNNKLLDADRFYANVDIVSLLVDKEIIINSVRLSDFEINLSKETKDAPLNLQFVIDAFKSEEKDSKPLFELRKISIVAISDGCLTYNVKDQPEKQGRFDENHLSVTDLNTRLALRHISGDSLNLQVKKLSLKEKSGLQVNNLVGRFLKKEDKLTVKGFSIDLPNSHLRLDRCEADLQGNPQGVDLLTKTTIDCQIGASYITLSDVAAFVPEVANFKEKLLLRAQIEGSIGELQMSSLALDYGEKMHLLASGYVNDVLKPEQLYIKGTVREFSITKAGIEGLANNFSKNKKELPQEITNMGTISFNGEIAGYTKNLNANGTLNTDLGSIIAKANFGFKPNDGLSSFFKGDVSTTDFRLGQLLGKADMDKLSFHLSVDINKPAHGQLNGLVEGLVEQFDFRNYTYSNVNLNGKFDGKRMEGMVSVDGENGFLLADGVFDFSTKIPKFDFEAQLKNVRLDKLHLYDKYENSYLSASITANSQGLKPDDWQGQLSVDSLRFQRNEKDFKLNQFLLQVSGNADNKHITVTSDIMNGEVRGKSSFSTIARNIQNTLHVFLPALYPNHKPVTGNKAQQNNNLNFNFTIDNTENLSSILSLPVTVIEPIDINGHYNGFDDKLKLNVDMPRIIAAGMNIESGRFSVENSGGAIVSDLKARILGKKNVVNTIDVSLQAKNNEIKTNLAFENNSQQRLKGELSLTTSFSRDGNTSPLRTDINVHPGGMSFNDSVWVVNESHITLNDGLLKVDNFFLSSKDRSQSVKLDGRYSASDPSDVLLLTLQNVNLEYIFTSLNIDALQFGGLATGVVSASSIEGKPYARVNLKVKDFQFNQAHLGNLELFSDLDEATKRVNMKGSIWNDSHKTADVDGYINPLTQELSLSFDADKINVGFLNKYTSSLFNNVSGKGSGQVRLHGNFSRVTVEGKAFVEQGTLGINFLNTTYTFTDSIFMKNDLIYFNDVKFHDQYGHSALASGKVSHDYFSNFLYQIELVGENFLLYNVPESQNPLFSGTVFASGGGSISGDEQQMNLDVRIRTNEKTKVRMNFMDETVNEYSFITFRDKDAAHHPDTIVTKENESLRKFKTDSGMEINMSFYIDATPDAVVELVMDPVGGDILRGKGNGAMQFFWGTNSDPRLHGIYNIFSGSYNFTFQKIFERIFAIESGSTVQFSGNPFDAILDVTAIYRLNANLNDLNQTIAQNSGQSNVPVQCILNLTGALKQPNVKLNIALPSADAEIQRQVKDIMSTEDMKNRQIVYLLLLSRFYTPNNALAENQSTELASVASATLSSQLTKMLSQIDDKWQFGANVRTNDGNFSTTEVELVLSSHLFNDRLLINGNFGYRDDVRESAFIGDVDIEYLLDKNGVWRLKAYNHYNEKHWYTKTAGQTQGLGIMFKKDFDVVREIFSRRKEPLIKMDSVKIVVPDSAMIGSSLGRFIKIKE